MRASYCLPSGNYNVLLSDEELNELLKNGHITIHMSQVPCATSRAVFNKEKGEMEICDKKEIANSIFFRTDEPIADIAAGDHYIQFLCINIERNDKNGGG